LNVTFIKQITR